MSNREQTDRIMMEKRWEEVATFINITHSSPNVWKTIRKLSNDPTTSSPPWLVSANQDAHQLLAKADVTYHPHRNVLYCPRQQLHGIPF